MEPHCFYSSFEVVSGPSRQSAVIGLFGMPGEGRVLVGPAAPARRTNGRANDARVGTADKGAVVSM